MIWLSQSERDALIYVCSDLQAANTDFAVPRNARKVVDNGAQGGFVVDGESLVIVAIQGVIIGAGAVGFILNNVHPTGPTTTKMWQEATQGAGALVFDHHMYRPLQGPTLVAGNAVNAAKLGLALIGAPTANSWLQVTLALNHDVRRRGKHTALGVAYAGNSTS